MKWSAAAAACLLLTACGTEDDNARSPMQPVQPTSYVTLVPVTTPPPTEAPPVTTLPAEGAINPNEQEYVVVPNDGEGKIASMFGITVDQLYEYNGWPAEPRHTFHVDDVVRIPPNSKQPGSGAAADGGTATATGTTAPAQAGCMHEVVANDNPSRLAEKYDVPLPALAQANAGNPAWNHFQLGSEIIIPGGGDCP